MKGLLHMTRHILTAALSLLLAVPVAHAKPKKKKTTYAKLKVEDVAPELAGIKFGRDETAAMKWVTRRFQHHYDPTIARSQGVDKQRWIDKVSRDAQAAQKAAIDYKGGKTGFETSIVGKDFGRVKGERMIIAKVGKTRHYLLFYEGLLWRYAVTLASTGTFNARVAELATKIGPPALQRSTPRPFAGWLFKTLRVELRDERIMYNGDALVITHRKLASSIAKAFKKAGGRAAAKTGAEGLGDVLAEPEEGDADTSAADKELEEYERKRGKKKKKKKKKR